jgi:hypothetical protein
MCTSVSASGYSYQSNRHVSWHVCNVHILMGLLIKHEDEGNKFFRNIGNLLPDYTDSQQQELQI